MRAQRYYNTFEMDSDDGYDYSRVQPASKITLPLKGHEQRLVLKSVITPYAHTYMAVVQSLPYLRDYGMMESEFVRTIVTEITRKVDNFECKYGKLIVHIYFFRFKFTIFMSFNYLSVQGKVYRPTPYGIV